MDKKNRFRWGALTITSHILAVIGLISSYYFYHESVKSREPILISEPIRTLLVEASSLTDFPLKIVNKNDSIIEKDIILFKAYFWNAGKESIKRENILNPLKFVLNSPYIQIVDFKIIGSSRFNVINPSLNLLNKNQLGFDFDILEQNDGISFQILYSGPLDAEFNIEGVIEGVNYVTNNKNIEHNQKNIDFIFTIILVILMVSIYPIYIFFNGLEKGVAFLSNEKVTIVRWILTFLVVLPIILFSLLHFYYNQKMSFEYSQNQVVNNILEIIPDSIKLLR